MTGSSTEEASPTAGRVRVDGVATGAEADGSGDGGATPPAPATPTAPPPSGAAGAAGLGEGSESGAARATTTGADATIMKMADGGYRPAYSRQTDVLADQTVTLAVSVQCIGSDSGLLPVAVHGVETKYNVEVKNALADGGTVNLKAIMAQEGREEPVSVTLPRARPRRKGSSKRVRYKGLPGDSHVISRWRDR